MSETTRSCQRIVELISENHDSSQTTLYPDEADVAKFSVISGIQDEVIEFIKKKLFDSIELQQFLVSREVEFNEKYIDFLTKNDLGHYNNYNDLEELNSREMSSEERENQLELARNRLNGFRIKLENLGRREQKACDYFHSSIDQFTVFGSVSSENESFKTQNKSLICSINNSITLQKVKLICEKFTEIDMEIEISFWSTEVGKLIEKLDESEKLLAFDMIVEMTNWASVVYSNNNLFSLIAFFTEKIETKENIFSSLEKFYVVQDFKIENNLVNFKVLVSIFMELNVNEPIYRDKLGQNICETMMKILEKTDLKSNELMILVELFELVGQQLGTILERFDGIFTLFESKTHLLQRSQQSRVRHVMSFRSSALPNPIPFLSPKLTSGRVSVRNLTVIEYPEEVGHHEHTVVTKEMMRNMEREIRMKLEQEMRIEKEKKKEEWKKKEEEGMRKEQEEEENRRMIRLMELRKKNEEEEEKLRIAQQNRRRAMEEETRIQKMKIEEKRKLEEMRQREKEEEEVRKAAKSRLKRQKEEEELRNNKTCTFLENVVLYRHTHPSETYYQNVFNGKIIGLYFSAHWCPPSRDFTPVLRNFYSQVENDFEILFISNDHNQGEMQFYLQQYHGDWFHLPLNSSEARDLYQQCGIKSIPTLTIFKPDGICLTKNAYNDVSLCQNPRALINQWKSM